MNEDDMEKIMRKYRSKKLTPSRAIKIYCKEICTGGDYKSWIACNMENCPLFMYRMGKNPNRQGIGGQIKDSVKKPISSNGFSNVLKVIDSVPNEVKE